jgi:hypothetical protein
MPNSNPHSNPEPFLSIINSIKTLKSQIILQVSE